MTTCQLPRIVQPFSDRGAEPDAPHMGTLEQRLAEQTEVIAYRCSGTSRHWIVGNPGMQYQEGGLTKSILCGPLAVVESLNTWTSFACGPGTSPPVAGYPWRFAEGHKHIRTDATIACEHDCVLAFRCNAVQLVDAFDTVNGSKSLARTVSEKPRMAQWQLASQAERDMMRTVVLNSWIVPVDLPSNRMIALQPQVMVSQDRYDLFNLDPPGNVRIWLVDMKSIDVADFELVGY